MKALFFLIIIFQSAVYASVDQCQVQGSELHRVKNVVVMFDGYGVYNEKALHKLQQIMQRGPKCVTVIDKYSYEIRVLYPDGTSETPGKVFGHLKGGLRSFLHHFCEEGALDLYRTKIIYFDWKVGQRKPLDCLYEIQRKIPAVKTIVLGYSFGGHRSLEFAELAVRSGVRIHQGISVDPIPPMLKALPANYLRTGLQWLDRSLPVDLYQDETLVPKVMQVPYGIKWLNFWQDAERRKIYKTGLHGFPVKNASNHYVMLKDSNAGHWNIFYQKVVKLQMKKALSF